MTARDRAIALCRAVAADPRYMRGSYAEAAIRLGYDVHLCPGSTPITGDYAGADMEAVELASAAFLDIDPEPLGIEDVNDPRRELAAAELLEEGWTP